jgi:undecaprenyl-diphosphatase
MSIIEAIILGMIQGATEFLPISSDGHLVLLPTIFQMPVPDLALIGILHLGTLTAMLIYFWRDLWVIVTAVLQALYQKQPLATENARLGWLIAVGTIPAAIAGLTLKDWLETEVFVRPEVAAFFLLVTAALLVIGERVMGKNKAINHLSWGDTLLIGTFQAAALLPGLSRSASTISGGLIRGLERPTATRFSFLLGVPAIFGAGMLSLVEILTETPAYAPPIYVAGFVAAAVTGYLCIHFLLRWVRNHTLYPFAVYCVLLGGGYLLYSFLT